MVTTDELLTAGYSLMYVASDWQKILGKPSYQKQIKDKTGIKYYINCTDQEIFETILINPNSSIFTVVIKYWDSISKVEECINNIWKSSHCKYIELFPKKKTKYRQIDIEEQIAEEKQNAQK